MNKKKEGRYCVLILIVDLATIRDFNVDIVFVYSCLFNAQVIEQDEKKVTHELLEPMKNVEMQLQI